MSLTQVYDGALLLEDGRRFPGRLAGSRAAGVGEIVFTTNITGYQEVLTDPSFAGQVVVMTAPMVGNYGVTALDAQSRRPWVAGFVVRALSGAGHGWRTEESLPAYLERHDIPTLVGVDTRAVTRHVRELGAMRGLIVPVEWSDERALDRLRSEPPMQGRDLATGVTTPEAYDVEPVGEERGVVVCLDYGVKQQSLDLIANSGFRVRVESASVSVEEILAHRPVGVFVSNGPGDPEAIPGAPEKLRELAGAGLPVFGILSRVPVDREGVRRDNLETPVWAPRWESPGAQSRHRSSGNYLAESWLRDRRGGRRSGGRAESQGDA